MSAPLPYFWDGEAMRVLPGFQRQADQLFTIGERYRLAPVEERSGASHRHFFAAINEAWANLPERLAAHYPTAEHLRARALIEAGYCTIADYVCSSRAEAVRWAANLRAEASEYALVVISETVVRVFKPKSQSVKAMGREEFQASKDAVFTALAKMIGVTTAELQNHAEAA
ncbi:hypothetical protein [Brevundimonas sp.]|uniref:hypothetical protein n=1 Tax=Brevundimonas sp. TaxID=1871086 RepID=UPI0028A67DB9|nr:hypothetical protein [Brevundimonas sp.]